MHPTRESLFLAENAMQLKLSVLAGVALLAVGGLATAQDVQVVKIGHVAPMSGPQAHLGKDNQNGAQMAIDELNAQNLVIGGKKIKWELAPEDDAADPKQGTAVAQKLCDAKVAGVVGHLNSGTTIPASRIYDQCGIPMVTGAATNPELTKLGRKHVFRIIANDEALGAGLAKYAAQTLKLKKVAVVDDRTAYGQGVAAVFKREAQKLGMEVVSEQFTTDKATDFMAILTAIKAKSPEGIMYGGMDAQAGPMLRQMDQLGMSNVKLFSGDGSCTNELPKLSANAKALASVTCAEGGASLAKMPKGEDWLKRYEAKFPGQYKLYGPYVYDATMLLADAMKRANSVKPKDYLPFLVKSDYTGATAKIVFDERQDLRDAAITLYGYPGNVKKPM